MNPAPRQFDVIILGAGAAGLMCAAVAGQGGRRVAVLEHNTQPGRKILISGGGRCNFTNLHCAPDRFLSSNPHFAKSALALYQPRHFIELVERYGIAWHEKTLGQLFCDHSSRQIVDMLLAECERDARSPGQVEVVLNARGIRVEGGAGAFRVSSSAGEFAAGALVVATGGLSIPKLGATGLAYDLARQFGLRVIEPRPALVPLLLGGNEARWTELAGVAADVVARAGGSGTSKTKAAAFREKILVTHRGLSGPAVLQASSYWQPGQPLISHPSSPLGRLYSRHCLRMAPGGIPSRSNRHCTQFCLSGSLVSWQMRLLPRVGPTLHWKLVSGSSGAGSFIPSARRASTKPK